MRRVGRGGSRSGGYGFSVFELWVMGNFGGILCLSVGLPEGRKG